MEAIFSAYRERLSRLRDNSNPYSAGIAWVAGEIVPLLEAKIPLIDQGFMHSDLTYDVVSVWDGRFFRLDDHIDRLEASCSRIRLRIPLEKNKLEGVLVDMARQSRIPDACVQIVVTRGLKGVRANKLEHLTNLLYILLVPYVWLMEPEAQYHGGRAVVAKTVQRVPPGAMDPTVKNLQWGDFTRGMFEASDRGAEYAFLTDGNQNLTEGPGFNIHLVKDGIIHTPDRGCLHGITRDAVFEIAKANGIEARAEAVPVEMAYRCDEIFTSTTAGGILPITALDGQPVHEGKVGPITRIIRDAYWTMHSDPAHSLDVFGVESHGK
ncbi:hypothetical protein ED733_003572 [Metarhizium rileyi]|uniref:Aminotransferase, class IV n=1 Tax=Metarhizium rileyi (strain RCEF 4871) TaxID=1649241 RepID=A0A5C6G8P0_METRR|nr:hypothetical protein ED733_003572 [Metarhizium rileyi]